LGTSSEQLELDANWSRLAVAALSDLTLYPAPLMLNLTSFNHVQASVFQVSRTPGKFIVYLGCLFLVLGVFTMFYVRDRRIWVWLRPTEQSNGTRVLAAMTSQKRTLDFNREFDRFKAALNKLSQVS
jgi:cytochrome c biogenesis protein